MGEWRAGNRKRKKTNTKGFLLGTMIGVFIGGIIGFMNM
jgi:hypothetical protein